MLQVPDSELILARVDKGGGEENIPGGSMVAAVGALSRATIRVGIVIVAGKQICLRFTRRLGLSRVICGNGWRWRAWIVMRTMGADCMRVGLFVVMECNRG